MKIKFVRDADECGYLAVWPRRLWLCDDWVDKMFPRCGREVDVDIRVGEPVGEKSLKVMTGAGHDHLFVVEEGVARRVWVDVSLVKELECLDLQVIWVIL